MDYSYPFSTDWNTDEIIDVVKFFEGIEMAYENGIRRDDLLERYRKFKEIVPSVSEEKTYFREFEEESGYASYPAVKEMKAGNGQEVIKVKKK